MSICLRRREFTAALDCAAAWPLAAWPLAAWPLAAWAQQRRVPVIGYLSARSAESDASMLAAVRGGLNATGYVEGQNLAIE